MPSRPAQAAIEEILRHALGVAAREHAAALLRAHARLHEQLPVRTRVRERLLVPIVADARICLFDRLDENPGESWTIGRTIVDGNLFPPFFVLSRARLMTIVCLCLRAAMGCSMMITFVLDFWRLGIGPIVDPQVIASFHTKSALPFVY